MRGNARHNFIDVALLPLKAINKVSAPEGCASSKSRGESRALTRSL
jgi:hypothetical protein